MRKKNIFLVTGVCVSLCLAGAWLMASRFSASSQHAWEQADRGGILTGPVTDGQRGLEAPSTPSQASPWVSETNDTADDIRTDEPVIESVTLSPPKEAVTDLAPPLDSTVSSGELSIRDHFVKFGFEKSSRKASDIDTVILHSSFNNQGGDPYSVEKVVAIWKSYEVAPHFLIDRDGVVHQLVKETDIAYHAGVSSMPDGRPNVNNFSLGVEILNSQEDQYTQAQYVATKRLVAFLKQKYPLKHVLGHDDIAPGRKTDPWNFDWDRMK